jgi:hypothetical protein
MRDISNIGSRLPQANLQPGIQRRHLVAAKSLPILFSNLLVLLIGCQPGSCLCIPVFRLDGDERQCPRQNDCVFSCPIRSGRHGIFVSRSVVNREGCCRIRLYLISTDDYYCSAP